MSVEGLPSAVLTVVGAEADGASGSPSLMVHPDAVGTFRVLVTVPSKNAPAGSKPITFEVREASQARRASHDAVFVGPGR